MSWMRQSRQQPVVDLDTAVYLKRNKEIRAFTLIPLSAIFVHQVSTSLSRREVRQQVVLLQLCSCAQLSLSGLPGQGPWASAPTAKSSAIRGAHRPLSFITLPVGQVAAHHRPCLHSHMLQQSSSVLSQISFHLLIGFFLY